MKRHGEKGSGSRRQAMAISQAAQIERAGRDDPGFATTLAKGFAILETFKSGRSQLSNVEIARETGLTRPTVARLTQTLCDLGYLRVAPERGKYCLWARALSLVHPLLGEMRFRQIARPMMQEMAQATRGTVSIGMIDGPNILYIESARSGELSFQVPEIGFSAPVSVTAMGRALFSMLNTGQRFVLEGHLKRSSPDAWSSDMRALHDAEEEVAAEGFCLVKGTHRKEIHAVAAPLFIDRGKPDVAFAINCGVLAFRLKPNEMKDEIGPRLVALAHAVRSATGNLEMAPRGPKSKKTSSKRKA